MEDVGNTWACLHSVARLHEIWSGDLLTAITSDVILKKTKKTQSLIIQNKLTSQFHFYVSFYMQACLVLTCVSLSLSACRHWRSCHVHHASCTRNTGLTTSSHYQLSIIKWMFCFVSYITLWLIPGVCVCCFVFLQLLDKTNCCLTETLSSLHLNSNKQDQTCIFAKTLQDNLCSCYYLKKNPQDIPLISEYWILYEY